MIIKLNNRGTVFLSVLILLIAISVIIRSPPIILIATFGVAYLLGYPLTVYNLEDPIIKFNVEFRHGVLYRGEVEILKVEIINTSELLIPTMKLFVTLPNALYLVDRPNEYIFSLKPKSSKKITIPFLPTARGSHNLGPIKISIGDPFFLFEKVVGIVEELPFRIYPKRIGSKVSKAKSREVFSNLIGLFSTKRKGIGTDFHGLREYIRGDPVKIIDWSATARSNKLISKEFEEEKKLEVIIAIAAGTTTRGSKFDFMLGMAMDLYDGITKENHPVGLVIFDNDMVSEFKPSPSHHRKMQIWSQIYALQPRDVYADYNFLAKYVEKNGITNHLFILIGDLEYEMYQTLDSIRKIRLKNNNVMFLDVFGYPFTYQDELQDAAADLVSDNYGIILADVIGKGMEQDNVFRGHQMKKAMARHYTLYGYLESPRDNVINAIERSLFSFFGKNWKVMSG